MPASTLHYTLFFDMNDPFVSNLNHSYFAHAHLGSEALTEWPAPGQPFPPDTVIPSFDAAIPGSTLTFSFVERTGNLVSTGVTAPAFAVFTLTHPAPVSGTVPSLESPERIEFHPLDSAIPTLSGSLGATLAIETTGSFPWLFNTVLTVFVPAVVATTRTFVCRLPQMLSTLGSADISPTISDSGVDNSGVP
jgi:hypothetical protein